MKLDAIVRCLLGGVFAFVISQAHADPQVEIRGGTQNSDNSVPETLIIVPAGENAPESIVRVVSTKTIAPGKHRVNFAGGPCRSQSRAKLVYIVESKETLAKGALFFMVPVSSSAYGFALRRANSHEAAQYANCQWR